MLTSEGRTQPGGTHMTFVGTPSVDKQIAIDAGETMFGKAGDDYLLGSFGNDVVYGGRDDDFVAGGDGFDILYGGQGRDTFIADPATGGLDVFVDFNPKKDSIGIVGDFDSYGYDKHTGAVLVDGETVALTVKHMKFKAIDFVDLYP